MSIVSNSSGAFYERSLAQMASLRDAVERFQTQIATGTRIEQGSDDPIGASRLRALTRLEARGATEAENAARLGQDLAEAGNAIEGVVSILQRARELAVAAANDPTGANGRAAIADELEQMADELFARANTRSITGAALFAGTATAPAYVRDAGGNVSYNGNAQSGSVPVAPGTEIERGLAGPQVFEFEHAGAPDSAFAALSELAAAMRGTGGAPAAAARDAIARLDTALDTANRGQTVLGTRLAWVEAIQQDQETRAINVAQKRSDIVDTDIADTIVRLQQTMTALEASQASFARVSNLTLFNAL